MIGLENLVASEHDYRKFHSCIAMNLIEEELKDISKAYRHEGYGIGKLFLPLLLQFMEDLSDRELEKYLQEKMAGKWFCGFSLSDKTALLHNWNFVQES